jgi:single-strand DNA-binding protein
MAGENILNIVGTLGRDPELRYTTSGRGVCSFSVATNRRWMKDNEWQEEVEWVNVVVWGDLGENCAASLAKGNRVMVQGRIATRSWETKEGDKRYMTELVADHVGAEMRWAQLQIERIVRDQAPVPDDPKGGNGGGGGGKSADPVYGEDEPFVRPAAISDL